jgi:hypothetical protein
LINRILLQESKSIKEENTDEEENDDNSEAESIEEEF